MNGCRPDTADAGEACVHARGGAALESPFGSRYDAFSLADRSAISLLRAKPVRLLKVLAVGTLCFGIQAREKSF
jgi:hypothetical protein